MFSEQQGPNNTIDDLETPTLIVERAPFERNMHRMKMFAEAYNLRLRPHFKCHKSTEIALMQIRNGAVGICCQTAFEAETAVRAGIADVLITNQLLHPAQLLRVVELTSRAKVGLCFDHAKQVWMAIEAARHSPAPLDAYIEIDVGGRRCGVRTVEAAISLALQITQQQNLKFAGIQAYHGRAQHLRTKEERQMAANDVAERVRRVQDALVQAGMDYGIATGGGTGTHREDAEAGALAEVQPGSYLFMDEDYAQNEILGNASFEQSLYILSTLISQSEDYFVIDAGLKALAFDSGPPRIIDLPNLIYDGASDEHGRLVSNEVNSARKNNLEIGSRVKLVPGHCDPTINLHDRLSFVEGKFVLKRVRVDARR